MRKIGEVLNEAVRRLEEVGVDTARLDVELLFERVSGIDKVGQIIKAGDVLDEKLRLDFENLLGRRLARWPMSHILGVKEFWGREFKVDKRVLTPRPDSETVISALLELVVDRSAELRIADLGLGSGCLLFTAVSEFENACGVGLDISEDALAVARENAQRLGIEGRVELVQAQEDNAWARALSGQFDVVISNPPYIESKDIAGLQPEVAKHEPMLALDGGDDGLEAYRALIPTVEEKINAGGVILLEVGFGQADDVCGMLSDDLWQGQRIFDDLAGVGRVVSAFRK